VAWIVYVKESLEPDAKEVRIPTDVNDGGNAVAQARARTAKPEYDWKNAYAVQED